MKEVLQITISKTKAPKTKLGKWFYWKVYFPIWRIWRPKMLSKIYWAISEGILKILPKSEREKLLKEFKEIDVVIKNKTNEQI